MEEKKCTFSFMCCGYKLQYIRKKFPGETLVRVVVVIEAVVVVEVVKVILEPQFQFR